MKSERVIAVGALLVAVGIGIGALGSHALRAVLAARQLESLGTAVQYQIFNGLGVVLVGALMRGGMARLHWPAGLIASGAVLFSGGIYLMLAGAPSWLGLVTPVGGVLLMAGWLAFAFAAGIKKA
ncbi:MAG: DUF423 domain-containing protein [Steroidobacteraceae bacterium]